MPKLGFRTAGYREHTLQHALWSISAAGYEGVEICLEHPEARPEGMDERRARDLAVLVADSGLDVASVSYHGDGEPPAERFGNQKRAVQIASWLGTDVLILNASAAIAGQEQEQWDRLRSELDELLPVARELGVHLALEPEPGHFLHSSADMRRLLTQVSDANLKVNLDVGHAFLTDPDVTASIRALGRDIVHTHIEGMPAGVHRHLVPGDGDLDLAAVHGALVGIGFSGYYTVDLFNIADDPGHYARRSSEALRAILGQ